MIKKMRTQIVTGCLLVGIVVFFYSQYSSEREVQAESTLVFNHVIIDSGRHDDPHTKSVGDINGDGFIDVLVAASCCGGPLSWYEYPNWDEHVIASGQGWSTDAEVGDVDGDGDQDVVISDWYSHDRIEWYENPGPTGNPASDPWTMHIVGSPKAHDVEIGDLDKDGDLDIVTRQQGAEGNQIEIWVQETPTSWSHRSFGCPSGEGLHLGDLDKDGYPDVIIGGRWYKNPEDALAGTWTEFIFADNYDHPNVFPQTADINNDGRLDVVLTPTESQGLTYRTSWLEAPLDPKSSGWIEHIIDDAVETVTHSLGVADMDNDGDLDVVTAEMQQSADPDEVRVYLNGDGIGGTWTKEVIATTGSHSARVVDIGNDGDFDIVGANWTGQQVPVEMWENQSCTPTLDSWERHVVDGARPWQAFLISSADIDGDNNKDIITGGWWYKNPGDPGGAWTRNTIGEPLNNMAAVYDFDVDGDMDVLGTPWRNSGIHPDFSWARNEGSGTFTVISDKVSSGEGDFLQGVAVDHFQPAGALEVALSWHNGTGNGVQMLTVPADPSNETWPWTKISAEDQQEDLSAGDIDRDGDKDLLLGTKWLRNDGATWAMQTLSSTSELPDRNQLIDMNGDGRLDAVVGFRGISVEAKLAWFEQGIAVESEWTEHIIADPAIIGPMSMDVADMDGDGDFDVVVGEHDPPNSSASRLFVFENLDGSGLSWARHLVHTGDEHHDGAQVVDIDNDGDLDIISLGWWNDLVVLYENKGCAVAPPNTYSLGVGTVGRGTVVVNPKKISYDPGEAVELTAQPAQDWEFDGWSGDLSGSANPATLVMDRDKLVTAKFTSSLQHQGFLPIQSSTPSSGEIVSQCTPERGLLALYRFDEGSGTVIHDVSGVAPDLDLSIGDGDTQWLAGGGLNINTPTLIASAGRAEKVNDVIRQGNQFTIEAWIKSNNIEQDGPARIVTLSADHLNRNFTLGQGLWGDQPSALYDVRLRTTETDQNGQPSLTTQDGSANTDLTHLVYVRHSNGNSVIYINGAVAANEQIEGDLSNWETSYRLALANELVGGKPWLGGLYRIAIYSCALSPDDVKSSFGAGWKAVARDRSESGQVWHYKYRHLRLED